MQLKYTVPAVILAGTVAAQQSAYGQCGGQGWTGPTTCQSGYTCTYSNAYYSQCLPGTAATTAKTTTKAAATTLKVTTTAAASNANPTLYMAGDSTMAKAGAGDGSTDGWGQYIGKYLSGVVVSNQAMGGRSARSYTREGRFNTIINSVKAGDYVVIEFGHNDGGSLATDNGRSDCPGTSTETCKTTYNGVAETVLTFSAYLENATKALKAKGANVIISSQTPNNPYDGGTTYNCSPSRFVGYAQTSASRQAVPYVDHEAYACDLYKRLGASAVNKLYPNDHTHTSPTGADDMARSFIKGLSCGSAPLKSKINASAASVITGSCL